MVLHARRYRVEEVGGGAIGEGGYEGKMIKVFKFYLKKNISRVRNLKIQN
jgi:hypothetical protein